MYDVILFNVWNQQWIQKLVKEGCLYHDIKG